jgi:hypothetical protein
LEGRFVRARWLAIAADFAHELQDGSLNLVLGWGSIRLSKLFDAAAHGTTLQ